MQTMNRQPAKPDSIRPQRRRLLLVLALMATSLIAVPALALESSPPIRCCVPPRYKTTTTLKAAPTSMSEGEKLTLTATVKTTKNVGYFVGTVTFVSKTNGISKEIGKAAMVAGVAKFSISDLPVGTYVLTASFASKYGYYYPSISTGVNVAVKKSGGCNVRDFSMACRR